MCLSLTGLMAQKDNSHLVPVNYMQDYMREVTDLLNGQRSLTDCKNVFLIFKEDPTNLGFKKPFIVGNDVKPEMEANLTGDGTKKILLSLVGDAVQCAPICASALINDWNLEGANVLGANMTFGPFTKITPKQPGKYMFIGMTPEQCFVVDANAVICKPDTVTNIQFQRVTDTLKVEFVSVVTGTSEEIDFDKLEIFPNPVQNELIISHSEPTVLIKVFDLNGNQKSFNNIKSMEKIDLSDLNSGIYIIEASAIKDGKLAKRVKKISKM
jgi:hypothetical protein